MEQTLPTQKRKLPKWLIALIVTPLVIIAIHFHVYSALKKEFHADQSVNPEATSYFLHASAVYIVWIGLPHEFLSINYDSPLLKPFLSLRDYLFEKGEAIMPPDNAENAIWWLQNYNRMYGFSVEGRKDESMAIDTLDKPTQRAIREKIYNYIIKLDKYGIKGIKSEKFAHSLAILMTDLVACYLNNGSSMFEGDNEQERVEAYYMDKNLNNKILNIGIAYNHFIDQYGGKKDQYYFSFYKYRLLSEIIIRRIALTDDFRLHKCDEYIDQFQSISNFMIQWTQAPISDGDTLSRRIKHDFIDIAVSKNPDYVSNIIISNIKQQCSQKNKTIQGVNNGR
jgi:hypothetical protein